MKVLQLCTKPLFAPFDGGKIAMLNLAQGLKESDVDLIQWMISTPKHPIPERIPADYPFEVHHHFIDTRIKPWDALLNLFSSKSYNLSRFETLEGTRLQTEWLQKNPVDVIQAESIYALTGIRELRKASKATLILRAHNVEFLIWKRMADQCRNPLKKAYLNLLSYRLRNEEIDLCNACDGLVVMSEIDAAEFRNAGVKVPIEVIGISTPLKPTKPDSLLSTKQLFHLGAMDWLPNIEGVDWFIQSVWPEIHQALPDWKFILAGKNMPDSFQHLQAQNIEVKQATDAVEFMQDHGIMIVPLMSGSGIRVKIIEGLALGKVIITTVIGLEGIPAVDGKHILIVHKPTDFLRHLQELIASPERAIRISENAITFANEHFRSEVLTKQLLQFYEKSSSPV